jgi:hypothetical protein
MALAAYARTGSRQMADVSGIWALLARVQAAAAVAGDGPSAGMQSGEPMQIYAS